MTGTVHIVVAMKPMAGNFVANAKKHGVAGLNIDGARIGTSEVLKAGAGGLLSNVRDQKEYPEAPGFVQAAGGRWPANVILDVGMAMAMDGQSGDTSSTRSSGNENNPKRGGNTTPAWGMSDGRETTDYRDFGGASRYFKVVKGDRT